MSTTSLVITVLEYLRTHPGSFKVGPRLYRNEVTLLIDTNHLFPGGKTLFPQGRLHADRLSRSELLVHDDLITWLSRLIFQGNVPMTPHEIWFTGSHIADSQQWILQISFE